MVKHILLLFIIFSSTAFGQLRINEFVSSNSTGLADYKGENNDWIELYNIGNSLINIQDYSISDDRTKPEKWIFPKIMLPAKSHFIFFASGENRYENTVSYHTVADVESTWKYFIPTSDIDTIWRTASFDDSAWKSGISGFGYGDDDDNTLIERFTRTLYIRKKITITNPASVENIVFNIDYDDGYVTYINGKEVLRENMSNLGRTVKFDDFSDNNDAEALMYQGKKTKTNVVKNINNLLIPGENIIAIEVHNGSETSADMTIIPIITLGYNYQYPENRISKKIDLPNLYSHSNFSIKSSGESLFLYNKYGQIVDSITATALPVDVSYGRYPDGADLLRYFRNPTPNGINNSAAYIGFVTDSVHFSEEGGAKTGAISVALSAGASSDNIYYTTDGSVPTIQSYKYTQPLMLSRDTAIRAAVIKTDFFEGPVVSNSYVFDRSHTFPLFFLTTDPKNLYDEEVGLFTKGPNASTSFPYAGANFWQDWERKIHLQMYEANGGQKVIDQYAGVKVFGGFTRGYEQKSLAVFARGSYGDGDFSYKMFNNRTRKKFDSFILRNGGSAWQQSMFNDGLLSTAFENRLGFDLQAFRPAVTYINGKYYGITNVREKVNETYLEYYQNIKESELNLGSDNFVLYNGSIVEYSDIYKFIASRNFLSDKDLEVIASKVDLDNYANYMATQIFIDNQDWPGNNVKFYNTTTMGSKWRYLLYDMDAGLNLWFKDHTSFNSIAFALDSLQADWPNPAWSTLMFRRMLSNQKFRNQFINQYADHLNTTFQSSYLLAVLDSFQTVYDSEIVAHRKQWGMHGHTDWLSRVGVIREFLTNRPTFARNHIKTTFDLKDTISIGATVFPENSGLIKVNSVTPSVYPFSGIYFKDVPISLTAIPKPGYKFVRWQNANSSSMSTIPYNSNGSAVFAAIFEKAQPADFSIVINEINYKSSEQYNSDDWVELANNGTTTIDLTGWQLTNFYRDSGYIFKPNTHLMPGEYMVVARDKNNFISVYPNFKYVQGNSNFGCSSLGDTIRLFDNLGAIIDEVVYNTVAPWPTTVNGTGATMSLVKPDVPNQIAENWKASYLLGTPGAPNTWDPHSPIVEKEGIETSFSFNIYPNPVQHNANIYIDLSKAADISISIFDLQGRKVSQPFTGQAYGGINSYAWNPRENNIAPGIYLIKVTMNKSVVSTRRVVVLN